VKVLLPWEHPSPNTAAMGDCWRVRHRSWTTMHILKTAPHTLCYLYLLFRFSHFFTVWCGPRSLQRERELSLQAIAQRKKISVHLPPKTPRRMVREATRFIMEACVIVDSDLSECGTLLFCIRLFWLVQYFQHPPGQQTSKQQTAEKKQISEQNFNFRVQLPGDLIYVRSGRQSSCNRPKNC
jgi:hypothetical protein